MLKKSILFLSLFLITMPFLKSDEFKEIKEVVQTETFKEVDGPFKSIQSNEILEEKKLDLKKILWDNNIFFLLIAITVAVVSFFFKKSYLRYLIMLFSLIFFGFYIGGCNCSVGAIIKIFYELFYKDQKILISILLLSIPFVSTFLFGRIFCGYICPIGALQELVNIRDKIIKIPPKVESILRKLRLVLFIILVIFSIALHKNIYADFAPFKALFNLKGSVVQITLGVAILALSLFIYRPFCRFLCPLGIFLEKVALFSLFKIKKDQVSCDKCTFCYKSCKINAIDEKMTVHNDLCIRCGDCLICKKCKSEN